MYLAELNANQAKTYFPMLEDNGLLKVRINNFPSFDSLITRWYSITQKGYRFLEMWQMLEKDNAIIARRRARDRPRLPMYKSLFSQWRYYRVSLMNKWKQENSSHEYLSIFYGPWQTNSGGLTGCHRKSQRTRAREG